MPKDGTTLLSMLERNAQTNLQSGLRREKTAEKELLCLVMTSLHKVELCHNSDQTWSKVFFKLLLACLDEWGRNPDDCFLRFREKYQMLVKARVDFGVANKSMYV